MIYMKGENVINAGTARVIQEVWHPVTITGGPYYCSDLYSVLPVDRGNTTRGTATVYRRPAELKADGGPAEIQAAIDGLNKD